MSTRTSQTTPAAMADTDAALLLDNQVCFALYSASLAMTRLYKPLLADLGLTYPQYLVMLVLWEGDALMVSALGERLGLDSGTLTPLLKRLEALGLLTRQRDPQDERRVHVHLSPAGRHLKARARKLPACILESTRCSLDELRSLNRQVRQLHQRLLAANDI
jgi:DNA-binding MarR family transcriptional regulator